MFLLVSFMPSTTVVLPQLQLHSYSVQPLYRLLPLSASTVSLPNCFPFRSRTQPQDLLSPRLILSPLRILVLPQSHLHFQDVCSPDLCKLKTVQRPNFFPVRSISLLNVLPFVFFHLLSKFAL
jgi:hypothetical protein